MKDHLNTLIYHFFFTFALRQRATKGGDTGQHTLSIPVATMHRKNLVSATFLLLLFPMPLPCPFLVLHCTTAPACSFAFLSAWQAAAAAASDWSLYTNSIQHFTCQSQPPSPRVPGTSCLLFYGSTLHFQQINLFVCNIFSWSCISLSVVYCFIQFYPLQPCKCKAPAYCSNLLIVHCSIWILLCKCSKQWRWSLCSLWFTVGFTSHKMKDIAAFGLWS